MQPPNHVPGDDIFDLDEEEFSFQDDGNSNMLAIPYHVQQQHASSSYNPGNTIGDASMSMNIEPNAEAILDLDAALENPNLYPDDSQKDLMTLQDDLSKIFERDRNFENNNETSAGAPTSNPIATAPGQSQPGQIQGVIESPANPAVSEPPIRLTSSVVSVGSGESSHSSIQIIKHKIGCRRKLELSKEARKERPYACVVCFTNRHFKLCQPPHLINDFRSICRVCGCTYDLNTGKGNRKGVHGVTGVAVAEPGDTKIGWIDHACAGTITLSTGVVRTGLSINSWELDACLTCGHEPGVRRDQDATPVCIKE